MPTQDSFNESHRSVDGAPEQAAKVTIFQPSHAQQRLWLLEQLQPESALYNITSGLHLRGALNLQALRIALNQVVARHESLRTVLRYQQGALRQYCLDRLAIDLRVQAPGIDPDEFLLQEYRQPFDLAEGPLLRAAVLRLGDDEHLLALSVHHIVSDGASSAIIARDIAAFYNGALKDRAPDLPELPIQYADYAEWQRGDDLAREAARQLQYWRKQLADIEPLRLPHDRPRPARQSFRGRTLYFELADDLVTRLSALSGRHQASLYMTLLATFYVLLKRYSGQSDLSVGTPVSGRERVELEGLVGFLVNTLVLRLRLEDGDNFGQVLRQVRDVVLAAHECQDVAFDRIVEHLQPERDLSQAPLFQVMFAYQESEPEAWALDGLAVTPRTIAFDTSKFDLTLSLDRGGGALRGAIEYSTDLFDDDTIARFRDHYLQLLNEIADDQERPVSSYRMLSPRERDTLLSCFGREWVDHPVTHNLHQGFERQVELTPDAIALSCDLRGLTYADLNARANQLAHYLLSTRAPGAANIVGICLPRDEDLVVALLAVLKAGCAYLPIDPQLAPERVAFYLRDSGVDTVVIGVAQQELFDSLRESVTVETVSVDADRPLIAAMPRHNPDLPRPPEQLAYVLYTSGSTGKPKGVMVSHRNVVRLFLATAHWFEFGARDVWSVFHSASFDFSVWELWGALLHGGRAVMVPYMTSRSPIAFRALLAREGVTVLNQTPSAFKQFIAADAVAPADEPLRLRYVVFGGEALDPASLQPWIDRHGDDSPRLINMYGITETTVHVTYRRITRDDAAIGGASPIGVQIPDLRMYLLDAAMNPVPVGVIGEIYVGGAGLAEGYLHRPELTEQRFITVSPALEARAGVSQRLYRTGDLASYTVDGAMHYKGRADDQVKIRGFRIELGEVEAVLREHPRVREAVVGVIADEAGDKRMIAHVVARDEAIKLEQMRADLRKTLPDYMVPSQIVFLSELPLTVNGKIDRKALPLPQGDRPNLAGRYVAPRNATEQALSHIWREVLGLNDVGVHDNFFALGGDSLRGVQAVARIRALGLNASLSQLFEQQTVAELALALAAEPIEAAVQGVPFGLIDPAERAAMPATAIDAYPLSRMQAGMFYHMQMSPESNIYHCTGTSHLRLKNGFDEAAFREAVQATVARHDVLRTSFDLTGFSQPLQIVHRDAELPIVVEDLRALPAAEQELRIRALLEAEKRAPFDLSRPTLLRFFVQLRADDRVQFTMTECHPIFDGWSYHTMIVEVFNRYAGLTGVGHYREPPALTVNYRQFIESELQAVACDRHREFWDRQLDDCAVLELPRLRARVGDGRAPSLKAMRLTLPDEVYAGLEQVMRQASAPMKSVLLAGHLKVMSVVSGQTDVLTGIPTNGRPEETGGDQIYGLFLNTLPFRHRLRASSWVDLAREVFDNERRCIPFRRYPLAEIQRRHGAKTLLNDVLFNYMDFHVYRELDPKLGFEVVDTLDTGEVNEGTNFTLTAHFQHMTLSSRLKSRQVAIQIDYDEHQLDARQVEEIVAYYHAVYAAMARDPLADHARHDPRSDAQRQALRELNQAGPVYHDQASLAALFARQVARGGDATALVEGDLRYSYRELDARANGLANELSSRGLGRGETVGLYLRRSVDLIAAILAAVKLEAVYVPLDVEDPVERTGALLADAGCRLVLTQEALVTRLGDARAPSVVIERIGAVPAHALAREWPVTVDGDHPACVMYTSGSSGKPKGALIRHQGIARLVLAGDYVDFRGNARVLQLSAISFDASTLEIWGALLNGGTLILYPAQLPSLSILESVLVEQDIQTLFLTTSLFNAVVDENPQALRKVRHVIVGGEAMSTAHARKLLALLPELRLTNGYGPTENTTFTTTYEVRADGQWLNDVIPIGRPIANTEVHVLDAFGLPAPVGTPGELYAGGDGVALGYVGREDLTREKFVTNEFAGRPGATLYRTGDRVRWLPDGNLQFLGRLDGQVKLRGFRIEPGEIEHALRNDPQVRSAAVRVLEQSQGRRLVAYVVAKPGAAHDEAAVLARLGQVLPRYMLPSRVSFVAELPLTVNGKLDRARLLESEQSPHHEPPSIMPGNALERSIQGVWAQLLRIPDPGIHDNFFDLGGDSLMLARLHLKLRAMGLPELSMIDLLNRPTIHSLARFLSDESPATMPEPAVGDKIAAGRQRLAALNKRRHNA